MMVRTGKCEEYKNYLNIRERERGAMNEIHKE
jgi:hypothetical protein